MLDGSFVAGTVFYALSAVCGNVAIWLKQLKKQPEINPEAEEVTV